MVADGGQEGGEHPGGVSDERVRVESGAFGGVDAGDDGGPEPVSEDPVGGVVAEDIAEGGSPSGSYPVLPGVAGAGAGGVGAEVRGEAPPHRRPRGFGGQRPQLEGGADVGADGEAGGVGDVEPADEDRPEVVRHHVFRGGSEEGGPPVGTVGGVSGDPHRPVDEIPVVVPHRDPGRGFPGRPQVRERHGFGGPPPHQIHQQIGIGQVRDRPHRRGSDGPAERLLTQCVGAGADQLRAGGQVRVPFRLLGQGRGDGGKPGQRSRMLGVVPARVEAVVQHRGEIGGGVEFPAGRGGGEQGDGVLAVGGEDRQMPAQCFPGRAGADPGDSGFRPGGDLGDPFGADEGFRADGDRVDVRVRGRAHEQPGLLLIGDLGGDGPGGAVPGQDGGEHLGRGRRGQRLGSDHVVGVAVAAEDHVGVGAVDRPGQCGVQVVAVNPRGDDGVRRTPPPPRGADGEALHGGVGVRVPQPHIPVPHICGGQRHEGAGAVFGGGDRPVGVDRGDGEPVVVLHVIRPTGEVEGAVVPFGDDGVPGGDVFAAG